MRLSKESNSKVQNLAEAGKANAYLQAIERKDQGNPNFSDGN